MPKPKPLIPTTQLIKRLHLMADTGGMLSRDRIDAIRQAADRLEYLDERLAIMNESSIPPGFNLFRDIIDTGGDADEIN